MKRLNKCVLNTRKKRYYVNDTQAEAAKIKERMLQNKVRKIIIRSEINKSRSAAW